MRLSGAALVGFLLSTIIAVPVDETTTQPIAIERTPIWVQIRASRELMRLNDMKTTMEEEKAEGDASLQNLDISLVRITTMRDGGRIGAPRTAKLEVPISNVADYIAWLGKYLPKDETIYIGEDLKQLLYLASMVTSWVGSPSDEDIGYYLIKVEREWEKQKFEGKFITYLGTRATVPSEAELTVPEADREKRIEWVKTELKNLNCAGAQIIDERPSEAIRKGQVSDTFLSANTTMNHSANNRA